MSSCCAQRFQLKTLHAIAEGVTTRLAGRQEMPAPNLGYRSGAYHAPTWVPFQVLRAAQALPFQDADMLVSGPKMWILMSSFMLISVTVMMCQSCLLALWEMWVWAQLTAGRGQGLLTCMLLGALGVVVVGCCCLLSCSPHVSSPEDAQLCF